MIDAVLGGDSPFTPGRFEDGTEMLREYNWAGVETWLYPGVAFVYGDAFPLASEILGEEHRQAVRRHGDYFYPDTP